MNRQASKWGPWLAGLIILHLFVSCGKRCRDTEILPYPEELDAYMRAYKPGSWWVYENAAGFRDSVFLTEFIETWLTSGLEGPSCFAMPVTKFSLRTIGLDTSGHVYFTYRGYKSDVGALVNIASNRYEGRTLSEFGFSPGVDYGYATLIDTSIASVPYADVLRVDRPSDISGGMVKAIFLAKDLGIIGYVTEMDTFTLTNYHIQ